MNFLTRTPNKTIGDTQFYKDINDDGNIEKFMFGNNAAGNLFFNLYNVNDELIEQINCDHPTIRSYRFIHPMFIDKANDNFAELIVFTQNKDTIFLNRFDFKTLTWLKKNIFVTVVGNVFSKGENFTIEWITEKPDQSDILYFVINSGFSMFPRRIFGYNFQNDKIIKSLNTGSQQRVRAFYKEDGRMFFLSLTHAANNCSSAYPFPYHDTCVWIFSYDNDLKLKGKPKYLRGKGSGNDIYRIDDSSFVCSYWNYGSFGHPSALLKLTESGEITDSLNIHFLYAPRLNRINIKKRDYFVLIGEKDKMTNSYLFNPETFGLKDNPFKRLIFFDKSPMNCDVDHDGQSELILVNPIENSITIQSNNLKHKNKLKFPIQERYVSNISSKSEQRSGHILLTTDQSVYDMHFIQNPVYKLKIPFYVLVYIVCSAFVMVIMVNYRKRIEYAQKMERRIAGLQLQNFKNQLDPHFTFNALNSVASAIYKEDKRTAYDLFQRFSEMVRSSLHTADKVLIPLGDELQFTEDYLEFQKTRFKGLFRYAIEIRNNPDVGHIEIPKLLLQGIVENAVKHAFYRIDYVGEILIRIDNTNHKTIITIEDNGIGINASKHEGSTKGNGVGLKLLKEQLVRINKLFQKNYTLAITDLYESGGKGTKVEISLG
ncbi:sensor histidine kinase [Saccharicrinis sp. FJH54]|uniref:sensor histidine kinase n=1 Tax=Saccharicrinis sp. FJH54 TaxID=3344665 RepID=UPI0035D50408